MEFNEKLQELRKQKGLTQEELANELFVSRTAVSKWESGRGFPSIDSIKAIAEFFSITIDELLSSKEVLKFAEVESKAKSQYFCDMIFGLLDVSVLMLFVFPFFRQSFDGVVSAVSLLQLSYVPVYTKTVYYAALVMIVVSGLLILALQNCTCLFWKKKKSCVSIFFNIVAVLLFIISTQPYAAVFLFASLIIKLFSVIKLR